MLTDADIMAQVLDAFRAEQAEHRQAAGELLLELERDPHHPERKQLLDQLFREAHSLKGGARAAGLLDVERLAHRIEDVFAAARSGNLELTPKVCDPIYAGLDALGALMARHDAGEPTDLTPYQPLLDTLAGALVDLAPPAPAEPSATGASALAPEHEHRLAAGQARHGEDATTVRLPTSVLDSLLNEAGELMTCTLRAREAAREAAALAELPARWRRTWQRLGPRLARLRTSPATLRPITHHLDEHVGVGPSAHPVGHAGTPREIVEALEQANSLLGELGAAVANLSRQIAADHSRLAAVTDRLHDQVRRTRMLPLATLFPPLRLQLREMARAAGKRIELSVDDGGAEADRQVLDQLREVLLHLLRNAVDHGIEDPATRASAGKPESGTVLIC
ncbi:Hpt domain-containing protein, partial [Oscillochloris sp. ZM17-4]|uniref:Hpt domain-containing protein n=1 Tax=Oscillochloris sp. ZM17-4 TaxID=2866714 RepID=UPI001C733D10